MEKYLVFCKHANLLRIRSHTYDLHITIEIAKRLAICDVTPES